MEEVNDSPLQDKNSYIIKSSVPDSSYALLSQKLAEGYGGLCLTRTNPEEVKVRYRLDSPIIWLTNQKSDEFFSSSNIGILKTKVKNFIKKNEKSVVLLDRIDYLINIHGFNEVIKLVLYILIWCILYYVLIYALILNIKERKILNNYLNKYFQIF